MFTSKWWNLCWENIVQHILDWYICDLIFMFHIDIEGKCGWIWEGGGGGGAQGYYAPPLIKLLGGLHPPPTPVCLIHC